MSDRSSGAEDIDPGPAGVDPAQPDRHGDALIGATESDDPDPDALVEGNRVATAEDME